MLLCVCMCVHIFSAPWNTWPGALHELPIMLGLDTVFKHVSAQSNKRIAGGVAGQQQTLTISVDTPSKGYLRKEGESGRYLKTCQWALLPGSVEWQHGNLQGGLAARKSVLKVIVEHSSKKRLHPGDSKLVSVNIEDSVLKSGSEEWHWIWSNFRNVLVNFFARKFSFYI